MTPVLRAATVDDAGRLAEIGAQTFAETFGHLYDPADLAAFLTNHDPANWRRELADPRYHVVLAMAGDDAVGYAKLGPPSLPFEPQGTPIELRQFYVRPEWQGSGLAARMMEHMLAQARARGRRTLSVCIRGQSSCPAFLSALWVRTGRDLCLHGRQSPGRG